MAQIEQDTGWSIIEMKSGRPICNYDSLDNFNFSADTAIPTCPQEGGTLYSFDKTYQSGKFTCTARFNGDYQKQEAELASLEAARLGLYCFYVVNPSWVLENYNLIGIAWVRASNSGMNLLEVDLTFQEVRNATVSTGDWKPKQATAAAPVQEGKKQAENISDSSVPHSAAYDTFLNKSEKARANPKATAELQRQAGSKYEQWANA